MAHGDDDGLVVPPALAPIQAVVLLVKDDGGAGEHAAGLRDDLAAAGLRVRLDDQVAQSFGRRATDWELKGVPLRVEVGPRDLAEGNVTVVRRDTGDKTQVPVGQAVAHVRDLVGTVQADMLAAATARRDAAIVDVGGIDEAVDAAQTGFARLPWGLVRGDGEAQLAGKGITVRCLMGTGGALPASEDDDDVVAVVGRAY
jgi:prolyl-tRNA synthetase